MAGYRRDRAPHLRELPLDVIDLKAAEKDVKRVASWAGALTAIVVGGGVVTKALVADPLAKSQEKMLLAVSEERAARQAADDNFLARFRALESGESDSLNAINSLRIQRLARQIAAVQATVVEVQTQADSIIGKVLKRRQRNP